MQQHASKAAEVAARMIGRARPEPSIEPESRREVTDEERQARRLSALEGVPARFRTSVAVDALDVAAWVKNPAGRNLVLTGPVGSGKSHLAAMAVVSHYAAVGPLEGGRFRWTTAAALMERSRPGAEPDGGPSFAVCRQVPILVLDDLGAERGSDWTLERIAMLLDDRWSAEQPTVVTTNLGLGPEGPLATTIGPRAYSRLVGDGAVVVHVGGIDRRRGR